MSDQKCGHYDGHRYCRNKPYSVRHLWDGTTRPWLCRKHTAELVAKFEKDNRQLAFYLEHRHLLAAEASMLPDDLDVAAEIAKGKRLSDFRAGADREKGER